MAYNVSVQASTSFVPFLLMFGHQARLPVDLIYGKPAGDKVSPQDYATHLKFRLESAYHLVRKTIGTQLKHQNEL